VNIHFDNFGFLIVVIGTICCLVAVSCLLLIYLCFSRHHLSEQTLFQSNLDCFSTSMES